MSICALCAFLLRTRNTQTLFLKKACGTGADAVSFIKGKAIITLGAFLFGITNLTGLGTGQTLIFFLEKAGRTVGHTAILVQGEGVLTEKAVFPIQTECTMRRARLTLKKLFLGKCGWGALLNTEFFMQKGIFLALETRLSVLAHLTKGVLARKTDILFREKA